MESSVRTSVRRKGQTNMNARTSTLESNDGGAEQELTLCALQLDVRSDNEHPTDAAKRWIATMEKIQTNHNHAIDLFVLPELAPLGYSEDSFAKHLPTTGTSTTTKKNRWDALHEMDQLMEQAARHINAYICYGTIGQKRTHNEATTATTTANQQEYLTIRQVVLNGAGKTVATYDKGYLCDYGDCAETRFFTAGDRQPVSFFVKGFRFGLLICADMRYPALSRRLAREHSVDVLLQPAAFTRDVSFRTWRSFRETRAVENSCYFVGVNYAGDNFGETSIVPPWVDEQNEPVVLGTQQGPLVGCISRKRLNNARTRMPFYRELIRESTLEKG